MIEPTCKNCDIELSDEDDHDSMLCKGCYEAFRSEDLRLQEYMENRNDLD